MTNHYHLLLKLTCETLSKGLKWLNGEYATHFNDRYRRVGHVFQSRPNTPLVQDESYFLNVLRYVVLNPVRAKIVTAPED